jgi:predicted phage terminase large subunit-like protein
VDPRWFGTYEQHQLPEKFTLVLQSWDTATKVSQLNDYSVCTTWGIKGKQIYLLNVFRKRLSYPDLKRAVREQHGLYQPSVVLIEDRSSGTQLLQELKQEGLYAVQAAAPEGDKVMRLHAQTATVENGFVFLPRDSPWRENYLDELAAFPNSRYDDQVDSTSQALSWLMQRSQEPALLTHYRRELEKVKKPLDQQPLIKLKAPYGISHVVVKACQVAVGNDGIVQLPKEDAAPFIRSGWEVCPP